MKRIAVLVVAWFSFRFLTTHYPEAVPTVLLLLPSIILFSQLRRLKESRDKLRSFCLRQKQLADSADLPDCCALLGIVMLVAKQAEVTAEQLEALVKFGCRLSLCDLFGETVINLEDPRVFSTLQVGRTELFPDGEIFELPGLRGGQKDRIGEYKFWRMNDSVCFGKIGRADSAPEFIISFDGQTLAPLVLATLTERTKRSLIYRYVWGLNVGKIKQIVL